MEMTDSASFSNSMLQTNKQLTVLFSLHLLCSYTSKAEERCKFLTEDLNPTSISPLLPTNQEL